MDLIDREELLSEIRPVSEFDEKWACTGSTVKKLMIEHINRAPTVDAVPVVHGNWKASYDRTFLSPCFQCSICGRKINTFENPIKTAPYCHCDAKMDGKVEDGTD